MGSWGETFDNSSNLSRLSVKGQLLVLQKSLLFFSGMPKPYAADIADLNSDGLNDIVIGALEANEVRVFWGNENGEWTSQILSSSSSECFWN